jgi:hypothetical protein
LAIDSVKLFYSDLSVALNAQLTALIATATSLKDGDNVPANFDKTAIETAITNAQAALSSGDSSVKQAAIDALNTEIAALQTAIQNANTVSLADIISGQKYLLKHVATGMYLQFLNNDNDGDFCLNALPAGSNANFDFIFTAVAGAANTYMLGINSGANSGYMSGSGWNVQLADPATALQKQIILLDQGDNIVWLRAGWLTSNVMNFDCINAACRIYANKSGSANAQFKIELSPNALDMNALIATARQDLQSAINTAQTLNDNTAGGTMPGQYTGKTEFTAAIAAANAVYNNTASTLAELLAATETLIAATETYKATRINPYTGFRFKLKQLSSGLYLSKIVPTGSSDAAVVQDNDATGYEQIFEFEEVAGVTNGVRLKSSNDTLVAYYLYYSSYNSRWTTSPATTANLVLEEDASGEFIRLKFSGNSGYFSSDGTSAGSAVYTDKASTASNGRWVIEVQDTRVLLGQLLVKAQIQQSVAVVGTGAGEYPQSAVDSLTNVISSAQTVYNNSAATDEEIQAAITALQTTLAWFVNVPVARAELYALIATATTKRDAATAGTAIGNHPQAAIDALTAAISAAQAVVADASKTDEEINAAKTALQTALDLFISQEISYATQFVGQTYNIIHYGGMLLSKSEGESERINAYIYEQNKPGALQEFTFVAAPGQVNTVALRSSDGKYLYYSSWNALWSDDIAAANYLQLSATADGYMHLKFTGNNLLGPNADTDSATVYCDKSGDNSLYKWFFQAPGQVIKARLSNVLTTATTLLNATTAGTANFQFPQADVDALTSAKATAQGVYDNANATQAEVDAQVTALTAAIQLYYKKQILPVFTPETAARYLITNKTYSGYLTDDGARATVSTNVPLDGWEILKLTDSTYVFKQGDLAMAHSLNMVSYAAGTADQIWKLHYDGAMANNVYTPSDVHYYAFIGGANAIQFASSSVVQIASGHSHTNQAQWFKIDKIAAPITTALSALIATVQSTLSSATVGTAYGTYPQAAKDSLQTALTDAQTALTASTTQAEINAAVTVLQDALTWFNNQKNVWKPAEGMLYYIGNRDNANYLSLNTEGTQASYAMDAVDITQQLWSFVPVPNRAGFYQIVNGTKALSNPGNDSYTLSVVEYDAASTFAFEVKYTATASGVDYFLLSSSTTADRCIYVSTTAVGIERFPSYNYSQHKLVAAGALRTEIVLAQQLLHSVSVGNGIGQYTQAVYDAFADVINASVEIAKDNDNTNDDAQVAVLQAAENTFRSAQNGYGLNLNALLAAVETANDLLETTTIVGSSAGQCPQTTVDALSAAVAQSQDATGGITQTVVDQKVVDLNQAIVTFQTALKASTGLTALIADCTTQHDAAVEGTLSGQYAVGSKMIFKAAIDSAQVIFNKEPVVQANLIAAYNYLNAARTDFDLAKVDALYTIDLEALIAEVETFLAGKPAGEYADLRATLAEAKTVLTTATTQDEIENILGALDEAYTDAQAGIKQLLAAGVKVYAINGALHISGLTDQAQVGIFNTLGQRIVSAKATGSDYVRPLAKGLYVVRVNSIAVKVFIR